MLFLVTCNVAHEKSDASLILLSLSETCSFSPEVCTMFSFILEFKKYLLVYFYLCIFWLFLSGTHWAFSIYKFSSFLILGNFFNVLFNYCPLSIWPFLIHHFGNLLMSCYFLDLSCNSHILPHLVSLILLFNSSLFALTFKIKINFICFPNSRIHTTLILFLYRLLRLKIIILCSVIPCMCIYVYLLAYVHLHSTFVSKNNKVFLQILFSNSYLSPLQQFWINWHCGLTVLILPHIAVYNYFSFLTN